MSSTLQASVRTSQLGLVAQLLEEGADVNAADSKGKTSLFEAATIGSASWFDSCLQQAQV
jgi:ankyrin repeat protein